MDFEYDNEAGTLNLEAETQDDFEKLGELYHQLGGDRLCVATFSGRFVHTLHVRLAKFDDFDYPN